jgi:hypothetical protein
MTPEYELAIIAIGAAILLIGLLMWAAGRIPDRESYLGTSVGE